MLRLSNKKNNNNVKQREIKKMLFCLNLNIWFGLYLFIQITFSPLIKLVVVNSYKRAKCTLHIQLYYMEGGKVI